MTTEHTLSSRIFIIFKPPRVLMCSPSYDPHETLRPQLSKTAQNKLHQPSVEETPHFEAPSAQIKYQGWTPGFSAIQTRSSERMPPPYSRPGLLNFSELAETRIRQIIYISEEFWDEPARFAFKMNKFCSKNNIRRCSKLVDC